MTIFLNALLGVLVRFSALVTAFTAREWAGVVLLSGACGYGFAVRANLEPLPPEVSRTRCARALVFVLILTALGAILATPTVVRAQTVDAPSASAGEYCERKLGTWFYCARPKPPPKDPKAATPDQSPTAPEIAEFERFQVELETAKKIAVWKPTQENVERYYHLQQIALDRGSTFADVFRRIPWTNPELDYSLKHPVNQLGKQTWTDERNFDRDKFINTFAGEIGAYYIFRSNCAPCQTFSPIVRAFSERYALEVSAISTDGTRNPYFGNTLFDHGQLKAWGVTPETPAVMVFQRSSVDPKTGALRPLSIKGSSGHLLSLRPCMKAKGCLTYLGAGVMSVDEIAERLYVLLANEPGTEF